MSDDRGWGGDGGWDAPQDQGGWDAPQDSGDWDAPPAWGDPRNDRGWDRTAWPVNSAGDQTFAAPAPNSDPAANHVDEWVGGGPVDQWQGPTEAPKKSKAVPIALGVTVAVLGVSVLGAGGWLLLRGDDDDSIAPVAEAVSTTAAGWTTSPASTTTGTAAPAVAGCPIDAIGAALGLGQPELHQCIDGWAVVTDASGSGDGIVVREVGDVWERVGSTSAGCPTGQLRVVMPAALLSSAYGPSCANGSSSSSSPSSRAATAPSSRRSTVPTTQSRVTSGASSAPRPVERAPAPAPEPAAPAPAPEPAVPPPPAPAPAEPPRDVAQDLQDLGNAGRDVLDALSRVRATTGAEG